MPTGTFAIPDVCGLEVSFAASLLKELGKWMCFRRSEDGLSTE